MADINLRVPLCGRVFPISAKLCTHHAFTALGTRQSALRGRPFPTGGSIETSFGKVRFRALRAVFSFALSVDNSLILPPHLRVKKNLAPIAPLDDVADGGASGRS